jgi:hypothetical protein
MGDPYELPFSRRRSITRRGFMQASAATLGGLLVAGPGRPETTPEVAVCPKSTPPARKLCAFRTEELTSFSWDLRLTLWRKSPCNLRC